MGLLGDVVGVDLLTFMLALNPGDVGNDALLDDVRAAVVEAIWTEAGAHTERIDGRRASWKAMAEALRIDLFCTYNEAIGSSLATDFHIRSGGRRPDISDTTSIAGCLQAIAVDCFAARIVDSGGTHYTPGVAERHPLMSAVREKLRDESEPLTQIFRAAFEATDVADRRGSDQITYSEQMEIHWSTGGGGSLHLRDVGTNIISSLLLDEDLDDQVLVRVAAATLDGLGRARRLAAGETVLVKTLVGLGEVALSSGVGTVEIAGGRLRRPTVLDRRANPFAAEPDMILELDQPVRYNEARLSPPSMSDNNDLLKRFIADNERRKKFLPELVRIAEDLQETIRRVRFAMVLASPAEDVLSPVWLFSRQFNPLTLSGSNSHQPNPSPGVVKTTPPPSADSSKAAEIAEWAKKMDRLPDSLKVGRRRLLQAITERPDSFDKFIDAVIAWETMFGAETEAAFRVTGSMAMLLEPSDAEARKVLFKSLSDLYSRRSKLVHGAVGHDRETKIFKVADVPEYARDAVRHAIDCFKRILDDPGLIPLDSIERSKRILLGI